MKSILVLGPGCANCERLARNAEAAARELGIEFEVHKVTDIRQITALGVLRTPGLAVDGRVVSSGRVLSPEEIKKLLA
jgi:small redox-active disulfide protein 2